VGAAEHTRARYHLGSQEEIDSLLQILVDLRSR
jgi:hypothetical protein